MGTRGRAIGRKLASKLQGQSGKLALLLPPDSDEALDKQSAIHQFLKELTSSLGGGLYQDRRYGLEHGEKKRAMLNRHEPPFSLDIIWDHPTPEPTVSAAFLTNAQKAIMDGESIASGVNLAKDIVNTPHNLLNPLSLADTAKRLAHENPSLSCRILNPQDCERLGMGGG